MGLVNKWLEKPFSSEEHEDLIHNLNSSNPHLEVSECALSLGLDGLYQISSKKLTKAETLVLELISIRNERNDKKMFENIAKLNFKEASLEMLDSRWAKQTPNRAKYLSDKMSQV